MSDVRWQTFGRAAVVGVAAVLAGCSDEGSRTPTSPSEKRSRDAEPAKSQPAKSQPAKPEPSPPKRAQPSDSFVMTAEQYAAEFLEDSDRHEAKYRGKTVELTGLIIGGGRLLDGEAIELKGIEQKLYVVDVQCVCRESEPWKKAVPGRTVRVRGLGPERPLGARIVQAEIVEVTGPQPPSFTADELSRAVAPNPARFASEYRLRSVVVSGEVAAVSDDSSPRVTLRTKEKPLTICTVSLLNKAQLDKLAVGERVTFVGQCNTLEGEVSENAVRLVGCLRLK